jgi:RimJ/RimL family protein N-acetyltransferase
VLADLWPPYGLRIRTPRLELRLPDDAELAALAAVAGRGVHLPSDQPFLTPWTDGSAEDRARSVLRGHWGRLSDWAADDWALGMGIFETAGAPLGMITLRATDFAVVREVRTTSWLGLQHQRQGFGTEARLGVLTLAFDHLGAEGALTEVFQDNAASQGVSRKLGYVSDGISRDARGAEVLVSDRLRLWRPVWQEQDRLNVTVEGVEACATFFGV